MKKNYVSFILVILMIWSLAAAVSADDQLSFAEYGSLDSPLCFDEHDGDRYLTVSLGIFSIVRIVRPAQYLVSATEYCVPDKECVAPDEDDPCRLFHTMAFPVNEFSPPAYKC